MLNVAIAVDSASDYGPRAEELVAAACEEVIGEHRCPVASALEPGVVAAWYAVVHPADRKLSGLRIEFRDRTADGVLIEERELTFSPRDSRESRLASAGSVIAAMAAAREGSLTRAPRREPPVAVPMLAEPVEPVEPTRPDWSIDVAGLLVPTFGDGPQRWGGLARGRLGWGERPFVLIGGRYAVHSGNPDFAWSTLSAGVGTRLGEVSAPFNVEFSGELVFEHARVSAEGSGTRESLGQSGWGGRIGVGAVWATWRHCSLIFGVDGTLVLPRINVAVADQETQHVPSANVAFSLGLRFQP